MRPAPPDQPGATSPSGLPYAAGCYTTGTIHYPGGTTGTLVVLKAGVTADAPWEIRSYYERHHEFPCDPTLDQLYDAERFDAYRMLGIFAAEQAWESCRHELAEDWARRPSVETTVDSSVESSVPAIDLTTSEEPAAAPT